MATIGVVSDWYDSTLKDKFLDSVVCPGDVLEFCDAEEKIPHWAIYAGHHDVNGWTKACVVHCKINCCTDSIPGSTVTDALFGSSSHGVSIERRIALEKFEDVLTVARRVRIFNALDREWKYHGESDVIDRAFLKLAEQVSIEMDDDDDGDWVIPPLFAGCKHFALWCRYDEDYIKSLAEKAENTATAITTGVAAVGAGAAVAGLGYLLWSQCNKKKDSKKK